MTPLWTYHAGTVALRQSTYPTSSAVIRGSANVGDSFSAFMACTCSSNSVPGPQAILSWPSAFLLRAFTERTTGRLLVQRSCRTGRSHRFPRPTESLRNGRIHATCSLPTLSGQFSFNRSSYKHCSSLRRVPRKLVSPILTTLTMEQQPRDCRAPPH